MSIGDRREREKKQRQHDIINAAEKLFFSKGFDNVSMKDIAGEVELSKATLYLYFQNKDSLFFAIVLRGTRILNSMIKDAIEDQNKGFNKVIAYMNAYNEFTEQYHDYIQIYNYFQSGRFNLANNSFKKAKGDRKDKNHSEGSIPYVSQCAAEIIKLRNERFSILRDSVQMGIEDMTIRDDVNPVEVAVLISSISKSISNIPSDRENILKINGISHVKYFMDVGELIHHMIAKKTD